MSYRDLPGLYAGIKQLDELNGVLKGILVDSETNLQELTYLATWLRDQGDALLKAPELVNLLEQLDDVLADGVVSDAESIAIQNLINSYLADATVDPEDSNEDSLGRELIGLVKGITSDQTIKDEELLSLKQKINSSIYHNVSIAIALRTIIHNYGNAQTDHQRDELFRVLSDFAGHDPASGVTGGLSMGGIFDKTSDFLIDGKSFVFTGTLRHGARSLCANRVIELGGNFQKDLQSSTDYLVIGSIGTSAWVGNNYGRKIEDAIYSRERFGRPLILTEEQWNEACTQLENKRTRYKYVDIDSYFIDWVYLPNTALMPAVGVSMRERIHTEKTKLAREKATKTLRSQKADPDDFLTKEEKKEIAKIKFMERFWAISNPIQYDFHEGDLFHGKNGNWVQITYVDELLEAHSNQSGVIAAYHLTSSALAHWLRTGVEAVKSKINRSKCHSENDYYRLQ